MTMAKLPQHQTIESLLASAECDHPASEVHGILLGLMAAKGHPGFMEWINEFMPMVETPDSAYQEALKGLAHIHVATAKTIGDDEFELPLLLPHEADIEQRTAALADLSRGVLFGLAAGGVDASVDLIEDTQEIIEDLTQLCHIEATEGEDNEDAFEELSDYLAVSIRLLHAELKPKHIVAETKH